MLLFVWELALSAGVTRCNSVLVAAGGGADRRGIGSAAAAAAASLGGDQVWLTDHKQQQQTAWLHGDHSGMTIF